jgi:hypothetical protein
MQRILVGIGLALAVALLPCSGRADDKNNPLAEMEKATQPGPEHKVLEPLIGNWTYVAKFWLEPGKPPMESKGTAARKWIMDGRYVYEDVEGEMFGKTFKGTGITGFDKTQGKYVGAWVDNFGTGISQSSGTADKTGKTLTFQREDYDPLSKQKMKGRDVIRILDADKHVMEMYKVGPDGKEIKVMELVITRKGK